MGMELFLVSKCCLKGHHTRPILEHSHGRSTWRINVLPLVIARPQASSGFMIHTTCAFYHNRTKISLLVGARQVGASIAVPEGKISCRDASYGWSLSGCNVYRGRASTGNWKHFRSVYTNHKLPFFCNCMYYYFPLQRLYSWIGFRGSLKMRFPSIQRHRMIPTWLH